MVKCSRCGEEIQNDSLICYNCGEKVNLIKFCPECGFENSIDEHFCINCNHVLLENKVLKTKNDLILDEYEKIAKELGIDDENYFLTSIRRFNLLEKTSTKLTKFSPGGISLIETSLFGHSVGNLFSKFWGNNTTIDGFFIIKENKFVFMELDNRDQKKVNAGINNFYFDKIVSIRVTKTAGKDGKYEDITKRTWIGSFDDLKKAIKTDINKYKASIFKDFIANIDSADMFDRLLIKLEDNTSYEIRLPNFELGNNLVSFFELSKNRSQYIVNKNEKSSINLIYQYHNLLKEGIITEEEFKQFKQKFFKRDDL